MQTRAWVQEVQETATSVLAATVAVHQRLQVGAAQQRDGRARSRRSVQAIPCNAVREPEAHSRPRSPRHVRPKGETIPLPASVFYVLERVAEVMARGDSITVVPVGREVTTQQAADLLNVSRQYLVRLLDEGRIPFRKTCKHRRLRIEDVLTFKEGRDKDRRAGLRERSRLSEDFGGYDAESK